MKDGTMHRGFMLADRDPLILKHIAGQKLALKRADIASLHASQKSLMPSAKMLNLSDQDLEDIARFLIEAAEKSGKKAASLNLGKHTMPS